jgi:2-haloacid dehalogenase
MFAELDLHDMNNDVALGAPLKERVYAFAEENPKWRDEIRMWHDNWLDLAKPAIPHSVRLLRAIRAKGIPVFALTNFGIDTWAIATPVYDFLNEFDHAYVSGHMGLIKPEARIYEMVEEHCGLPPESLLFADDRTDNIEAAQARGWKGHIFDGPQGWADCLVSHGVLTRDEAA